MLSMITLAKANAAKAAMRPLAGFGAGAFIYEGTWTESRDVSKAASPALTRIRRPDGFTGLVCATAGSARRSDSGSLGQVSQVLTSVVKRGSGVASTTQHFNQMTLIPAMIPGGLGSHPAREPDPV
jgi:hypothetical protein